MNCKKIAVIKFSEDEIEEFRSVVNSDDLERAIKILTKIDKKITDFIEPH